MYTVLIAILVGFAVALVVAGIHRQRISLIAAGVALAVGTWAGFALMGFWGEALWFSALEHGGRFWREIFWKLGTAGGGAVAAAALALVLTWPLRTNRLPRVAAVAIAAVVGALWGASNWETVALYVNRASTALTDPIFGRPVGFYLFVLPLYDALHDLLTWVAIISLLACIGGYLRMEHGTLSFGTPARYGRDRPTISGAPLILSVAALLAAWSWGAYLNRYHLLYSEWGAVSGAGWADINIRLPGYWITSVTTGLLAVLLLVRPLRRALLIGPLSRGLRRAGTPGEVTQAGAIIATLAVAAGIWVLALILAPGLMQWLRVEPNEITFERPYIEHNIRFTRHGFRLHDAEEREFPATDEFTRDHVQDNRDMFDNVRLWDYRALVQVYRQFQEIRLYYQFADVDIDRYMIDGHYRQVMVSAREMELANLPPRSRTFVNRHFKYTHGFGITLTTVSDFTPEGLPDMLVKDIPPVSAFEELQVTQPRIYYGELTQDYVIVNSREKEFDYPRGQENVYRHYTGDGGVRLSGFWRKFIYGWKFGGTRLLFSSYPTPDSRIMFRRHIRRRVEALAPFLRFDGDPYIVLIDGRLYWIFDAYTVSSRYPYSKPFDTRGMADYGPLGITVPPARSVEYLEGANYIRNSVKAVIDAYDGSVTLYVMDEQDPVIQTWMKVFPDLFTARDSMPPQVVRHIRYPVDFLLVQGLVYARYHMTNPEVFYNLEDLWIRATEKYYQDVQAVQPYYIMWQPPDSDALEYILMLPFTPKNRQVLVGWIAGMCDGDNYGRFLAYRFPKDRRLLGPQQVETKIDQDPHLSGQLTLWDQRGSNVIRGNVLAIPVNDTLLYVEPIYIQAETSAYPELRLVAVMHGDRLSYAETFEDALEGLFRPEERPPVAVPDPTRPIERTTVELIRRAQEAFDDYLRLTGEKDFGRASEALSDLQSALEELESRSNETAPGPP